MKCDLEILLPVHNEAASIRSTVVEIYQAVERETENFGFIISEDGSIDKTKEYLQQLKDKIPIRLFLSNERKGYSSAVKEGFAVLEAPYILCMDSDGQCDPNDLYKFWNARYAADIIIGRRVNRKDPLLRRLLSGIFYRIYCLLFNIKIHDPSCPYILTTKHVIDRLLNELGVMQQGFWWEFIARAHMHGFTIKEVPINHRKRIAGQTKVYKLSKLPGIGWSHFIGLFKILGDY